MSIEGDRKAIRQMMVDAKRIEARARIAAPDDAGRLAEQARALRAAAARIADRVREREGGHLV